MQDKKKNFFEQKYLGYIYELIKGTVNVISSEPPCKYDDAWFTTVPFKALSDQVWIIYQCL